MALQATFNFSGFAFANSLICRFSIEERAQCLWGQPHYLWLLHGFSLFPDKRQAFSSCSLDKDELFHLVCCPLSTDPCTVPAPLTWSQLLPDHHCECHCLLHGEPLIDRWCMDVCIYKLAGDTCLQYCPTLNETEWCVDFFQSELSTLNKLIVITSSFFSWWAANNMGR